MVEVYLEHITKIFGNVVAVDDLTLRFREGHLTSLLGPSGCGKTTTLRIIAGLETPTKGRVYFDEQDVTNVPTEKRDIALVFQIPTIYPTMNVYDNLAFPLRVKGLSKQDIDRRVKEVSELMGIPHVLDRMPSSLDAGTTQKVALAHAFIKEPRVYLLDEPLTNVDPVTRIELRTLLKEIQRKYKATMVYVTHDQTESMTLADYIAVMRLGKLLQFDTPEKIYMAPKNTFVGWFIGNPGMNFLDVTFDQRKGVLIGEGFEYGLNEEFRRVLVEKNAVEVKLGIRPEHISVKRGAEQGGIRAKCTLVEPFSGDRKILHLEVGGKELKAKVSISLDVKEGDIVSLEFPPERIHIYDKAGELII